LGNLDISKVLSDKVSIGFGSEFRTENFEVIEGDKASWVELVQILFKEIDLKFRKI
jgi:hypothetical protein